MFFSNSPPPNGYSLFEEGVFFYFTPLEEEVDSIALAVEDGGVPDTAKYAKAVEFCVAKK